MMKINYSIDYQLKQIHINDNTNINDLLNDLKKYRPNDWKDFEICPKLNPFSVITYHNDSDKIHLHNYSQGT